VYKYYPGNIINTRRFKKRNEGSKIKTEVSRKLELISFGYTGN
jgi:hypothetical protein